MFEEINHHYPPQQHPLTKEGSIPLIIILYRCIFPPDLIFRTAGSAP